MGRIKRIHVNRNVLQSNKRHGENERAIGIEMNGQPKDYAHRVEILGPSAVVHNEDKPLRCGARVWVETKATIRVDGREVT